MEIAEFQEVIRSAACRVNGIFASRGVRGRMLSAVLADANGLAVGVRVADERGDRADEVGLVISRPNRTRGSGSREAPKSFSTPPDSSSKGTLRGWFRK